MKKTAKRFSLGLKIASMLTCLVLTAVGFASWLIIKPAEAENKEGSFTVYEVETYGVSIVVTPVQDSIVFGKSATETANAHPWLVAQEMSNEALIATFDVEVTTGDGSTVKLSEVASQIKVTFDIMDAYSEKFDEAIIGAGGKTYLAAPVVTLSGDQSGTATYSAATGNAEITFDAPEATSTTFRVTVTFDWGTATVGENPYLHFNAQPANSANIDLAENMLNAIYDITGENATAKNVFSVTVETVVSE